MTDPHRTVVRAEVLGMCFGVRDALVLMESLDDPGSVTVHGELVHNPVVLQDLRVRGFHLGSESADRAVPGTERVLITAHGVSDRERARLTSAGKTLIDTTCPLVERVHRRAKQLSTRVNHVVVIGRPGHVEVRGIVEDLPSATVVPDVESVAEYPFAKLGVVCQTTTPPHLARAVLAAIRAANPHAEVEYAETICAPTREHQKALDRLLTEVDCVVVVGGANSNNTLELARLAEHAGVRAVRVADASELHAGHLAGATRVGLTAGTSTLARTVDAVEARIGELVAALEG